MNLLLTILFLFFFGLAQSDGQVITRNDSLELPKSVFDAPVDFSGWKGNKQNPQIIKEIRIGLFMPADSLNLLSQQMMRAASMAIEEINLSGGYHGIPYVLINRWATNPWGAGSKEVIKLVYRDSVWAVIGSIAGAATHVAEQIVTKAWLPLLSPISADPTLTYIRIPWIFRLPPDFKAQSEVIVNEGTHTGHLEQVGLITENNHDGHIFAKELNDVMNEMEVFPIFHFEVNSSDLDIQSIVQRMISFHPASIIICLSQDKIIKMLSELEIHKQLIDVFLPWIAGLNGDKLKQYYGGQIYCIEPFLRSNDPIYKVFAGRYQKRYQSKPLFGAAYTYDAVHILARAFQKSGLNRARLRDAIGAMDEIQGVTGKICWDNGGGNQTQPVLRALK